MVELADASTGAGSVKAGAIAGRRLPGAACLNEISGRTGRPASDPGHPNNIRQYMSYKIGSVNITGMNMFGFPLDKLLVAAYSAQQVRVRVPFRFIHTQTAADELHVAALAKETTT
jgi:hypothetical protein